MCPTAGAAKAAARPRSTRLSSPGAVFSSARCAEPKASCECSDHPRGICGAGVQIFPRKNKSREKTCVIKVITSKEQASCEETTTEALLGDVSVLVGELQSLFLILSAVKYFVQSYSKAHQRVSWRAEV